MLFSLCTIDTDNDTKTTTYDISTTTLVNDTVSSELQQVVKVVTFLYLVYAIV